MDEGAKTLDTSAGYYRDLLRQELARRQRRNPRYSLRAFAKLLTVDPAVLSRVIAGKRPLSLKTAERVAERLYEGARAGGRGRLRFLASVTLDLQRRQLGRIAPEVAAALAPPVHDLNEDLFNAIADWQHYAVLELTYTEGFAGTASAVAQALGLGLDEAIAALDRLLRLGLLVRAADGRLAKAEHKIHARSPALSTAALRRHQRQILTKALESLDGTPPEARAVTTLVLPTDPAQLTVARQLIEEFAWNLCQHLTAGRMTEVYALAVTLYPLKDQRKGGTR